MKRAFEVRDSDPDQAASLLADAGSGAALEGVRLEAWLHALASSGAATEAWQRFLDADLPADLRTRGLVGLGETLLRGGATDRGIEVLETAAAAGSVGADEVLLSVADEGVRGRAAVRLAVRAPHRLRRLAQELEREALRDLSAEQWLQRSAAWRRVGVPRQASIELGARRWRGPAEQTRRLEVARAEVASGRSSRALALLPSSSRGGVEERLLRAEAYRRVAWGRYPRSSARDAFSNCLTAARRAAESRIDEDLRRSLPLVVECATEAGALGEALDAWWRLASVDRAFPRREWIGRRLGVAMAGSDGFEHDVLELGRSLTHQRRCLEFWSGPDETRLCRLADARFADIYGQWAREHLGRVGPAALGPMTTIEQSPPPPTVEWLLGVGAVREAAAQWRRILGTRGVEPREALAAALLEQSRGRSNEAIRWLRAGSPDLGTVDMERVPLPIVRAYLPLRWEGHLLAAARESGVEPWLLAALARQESVFEHRARSPRGALGVLQVLPGTARPHGVALGLGRRPDLHDPEVNLRIGAREVARLQRRFGALEPVLAAYNAGETRARRWWRRWPDRRHFTEAVPIPETYTYIRRVVFLAEAYRLTYAETWRER